MYVDEQGQVRVETDDQCYSCEYFLKGVSCPLLEALAMGVVMLEDDLTVQNCGFYKQFKRKLRVLDSPPPEETHPPDNTSVG